MKMFFTLFATALTISAYAAQPTTAPAAPTQDAANVKALFCSAYTDLEFEPTSWGSVWQTINVQGTSMFYSESISWDCFTCWGNVEYDLSGYSNFCIDVYAETAGTIKLTFESNQNLEAKLSHTANFVAGWNKIDLDVKECYPGLTFKHIKYFVIDETSIAGQDIAIANAYFHNGGTTALETLTTTVKAKKVIENGQVVIIRDGVRYNAAGVKL